MNDEDITLDLADYRGNGAGDEHYVEVHELIGAFFKEDPREYDGAYTISPKDGTVVIL